MAADPVGILASQMDDTTLVTFNKSRNAIMRYDSKTNTADKMNLRDWLISFESAMPTDHSIVVW